MMPEMWIYYVCFVINRNLQLTPIGKYTFDVDGDILM